MLKIQNFRKIVIANWKLNGSHSFSREYFDKLVFDNSNNKENCLIISPPVPYIFEIKSNNIHKCAQDCSEHIEGAYTGEISAKILKDIGCQFCIIGHSERRNLLNEKNEIITKKIKNCIQNEIIPILCVGENLEQKKQNLTKNILKDQLINCLPTNIDLNNIIIAYEPIWSIGTGIIPSVEEISDIHKYIKESVFSESKIKVLYGGSVKANNYKELIELPFVDGLLVGGASINLDEFNKIIKF